MEGLILLILLLVFVPPIVAICLAVSANRTARELEERLGRMAEHVGKLHAAMAELWAAKEPRSAAKGEESVPVVPANGVEMASPPQMPMSPSAQAPSSPPPMVSPTCHSITPPPLISPPAAPPIPVAQPPVRKPPINWEHFLGVKFFAWAGGLALFFGIVFFVKLAFERNLIPPSARAAIGYALAVGLVVGGVRVFRLPAYRVLGQSLCASGVVSLYGVTFACYAHYRFPIFGVTTTALVMSAVTVTAFLLAVRMPAQVVAILGILGGFLTPPLVSTGEDHAMALFSFIAFLDLGVLAVTRRTRWDYLAPLAALGTSVVALGWMAKFFLPEQYYLGLKTLQPCAVFVLFGALFAAFAVWRWRRGEGGGLHALAALLVCSAGFLAACWMCFHPYVARRPWLLLSFVLALCLTAQLMALVQPRRWIAEISGAAMLAFFGVWTCGWLRQDLLAPALVMDLLAGSSLIAMPLILRRWRSDLPDSSGLSAVVPLMTSGLLFLPVLLGKSSSFLIWPALFLAALLGVVTAARTRSLLPFACSAALTLLGANLWLQRLAGSTTTQRWLPFLVVITVFAAVFLMAVTWLAKRFGSEADVSEFDRTLAKILPASTGVAPFGLLILALLTTPLPNPAPAFAVGVAFLAILLVRSLKAGQPWLFAGGQAAAAVMCWVWHGANFQPDQPWLGMAWYVFFHLAFAALPFTPKLRPHESIIPWAAASSAGVAFFPLMHDAVQQAFPNDVMGLLPAAFAIPPLLGLRFVSRQPVSEPLRQGQLAWFGGAALLFITLIFPVQWERHWITVGWAMEGAALAWLYRRVPHRGLWFTSLGLLVVVFLRLTLNPALAGYGARGPVPIWNWHLYTYGIAVASCFLAAYWLRSCASPWPSFRPSGWLVGLGGVLFFLLMNIEIADAFAAPGSRFAFFRLQGSLGQDMTYSIGWALFALLSVIFGLRFDARAARYAGIGLLLITLAKLFLYDLSTIKQVYRIAAFMGVALVALAASFLYQRAFHAAR